MTIADEEFDDGGFDYADYMQDEDDDELVIDPTRPMIAAEIAASIPMMMRKIRKARRDLKALGIEASRAKWAFEDAKHEAMKRASGSNTETRKAAAMTSMHHDKRAGKDRKVTHLGYDGELAEKLWRSQQQILASLVKELDVMRSLMVTSREEAKG